MTIFVLFVLIVVGLGVAYKLLVEKLTGEQVKGYVVMSPKTCWVMRSLFFSNSGSNEPKEDNEDAGGICGYKVLNEGFHIYLPLLWPWSSIKYVEVDLMPQQKDLEPMMITAHDGPQVAVDTRYTSRITNPILYTLRLNDLNQLIIPLIHQLMNDIAKQDKIESDSMAKDKEIRKKFEDGVNDALIKKLRWYGIEVRFGIQNITLSGEVSQAVEEKKAARYAEEIAELEMKGFEKLGIKDPKLIAQLKIGEMIAGAVRSVIPALTKKPAKDKEEPNKAKAKGGKK